MKSADKGKNIAAKKASKPAVATKTTGVDTKHEKPNTRTAGEMAHIEEDHKSMGALTVEAMNYADKENEVFDPMLFAKGIAVGALLITGLRKSGFAGGLAVFISSAIITQYLMQHIARHELMNG